MLSKTEGKLLSEATRIMNGITTRELENYANSLKWMSFGLDGQGPAKLNVLNELETSHLENILVMNSHALNPVYVKTILHILKTRKVL